MVSRRNRKIAPKRLGRKQTKKNWFQKLMYGGVVPKQLLEQSQLKAAIGNQLNIETLDTDFYDIGKLKRLYRAFKKDKKIYLIIKITANKDIIKPLFELVKDENGFYVIKEIKQADDAGTYDLSMYTGRILDIDVGKPTTYNESNLKIEIDKKLAELEAFFSDASVAVSGASAAVSGASASRASRKNLKTASNEEMRKLEEEALANFNPHSVNKEAMVASVKKANAQAKKTMSEGASMIEKIKETGAKLERTRDIAIDILKLNAEILELDTKIRKFKSILQRGKSKFDAAQISQIKAKITELTAEVEMKRAERDEMLQVQQQISFTGGATRKKNHKKRKHHPSKHTVKSK